MKLTRSEAMKLRHSVERVDGWLSAATAHDLAMGISWYDRAQMMAEQMAEESGLSIRACAGVIAALSPRQQWATNVAAARRMVMAAAAGESTPPAVGTMANRRKAWRIVNGEDPSTVLGGSKVRAFFANIMGDAESVTVDAWSARAAEGRDDKNAPKKRRYAMLSEAYSRAARRHNISPRDAQATVWVVYRRTHARALYDPA